LGGVDLAALEWSLLQEERNGAASEPIAKPARLFACAWVGFCFANLQRRCITARGGKRVRNDQQAIPSKPSSLTSWFSWQGLAIS